MVWSWSHTQEAYDYARGELGKLDHETLAVIHAEWFAFRPEDDGIDQFDEVSYPAYLNAARKLPTDALIAYIWERADAQANCDNGGWEAWMCPFGCGPHCVPFGSDE